MSPNVCGDDISQDLAAPSMLQISDAPSGVVEALGKNDDSIGMDTRRIDPAFVGMFLVLENADQGREWSVL